MRAAVAAAAIVMVVAAGCGGGDSDSEAGGDPDGGKDAAADTSTCLADAQQVSSFPDGYPQDFPLPDHTVVFDVEDRGADGVVATGVTDTPFKDVLDAMNAAKSAGFKVTTGETEEHDAEANWTGNGFVGRWAIRESATCPGETVVQLLSKKG